MPEPRRVRASRPGEQVERELEEGEPHQDHGHTHAGGALVRGRAVLRLDDGERLGEVVERCDDVPALDLRGGPQREGAGTSRGRGVAVERGEHATGEFDGLVELAEGEQRVPQQHRRADGSRAIADEAGERRRGPAGRPRLGAVPLREHDACPLRELHVHRPVGVQRDEGAGHDAAARGATTVRRSPPRRRAFPATTAASARAKAPGPSSAAPTVTVTARPGATPPQSAPATRAPSRPAAAAALPPASRTTRNSSPP